MCVCVSGAWSFLRCKFDAITTRSGAAGLTIRCIRLMQMSRRCWRVHLHILRPHTSFLAHPNKHLLCEMGASCICDPMFLSKSDSVKPVWYPLRLFSLIPFHTTRMALPTNNIADIHYWNKKINPKPVTEPSEPAQSQLKSLTLVLLWGCNGLLIPIIYSDI